MSDLEKKQFGRTLWNIANTLRGAMNADDFRDYMLSFLFVQRHGLHAQGLIQQLFPSPEGE